MSMRNLTLNLEDYLHRMKMENLYPYLRPTVGMTLLMQILKKKKEN